VAHGHFPWKWTGTRRRWTSGIAQRQRLPVNVLGGGGTSNFKIAELYDPASEQFIRTGDVLVERFTCPATPLKDGRVLLTGGTSGARATYNQRIADAEIYDPVTRAFTRTGSMRHSRALHTSTLLRDGKVLIAGGINEVYNPDQGAFREVAPMHFPRAEHAAIRMLDGRVLITGGTAGHEIWRAAEIFDPGTETFHTTAPMKTGRQAPTATLLENGDVLVVGGWTGNLDATAGTAEVFTLK
jgi:hypothetical protein